MVTDYELLIQLIRKNDIKKVDELIFSLPGTGTSSSTRLKILTQKDKKGKIAEEIAHELGFKEIESLLQKERIRIEYFE